MMKLPGLTLLVALLGLTAAPSVSAEKLVILHTNDTHSMIDPDTDDLGGVVRRKVVIDSVRKAEKNVLLVDAGDFVQGTLYFNLYRGEVEQKMMNELGYDIRILGNHEFDNGIYELADLLADSRAEMLSTNYDLSQSVLGKRFRPFTIREFGDKQVGFIGINLRPEGMISEGNYDGVVYLDAIKAANAAAWWLKNIEKVDAVVAITHIGYDPTMPPGDKRLAQLSEDIDVIIGGHSHDLIQPSPEASARLQPRVKNADGREIQIGQLGKSGKYIGKIEIDLDNLATNYETIRIDKRLDGRADRKLADMIKPYRRGVDSLMRVVIGKSAVELPKGGERLLNFGADFVFERGRKLVGDVDLAIVNKGGLRRDLPKGDITEGMIITLMPFYNYINVLEIKGRDLLEAFNVMAADGGNGVSDNVNIKYSKKDGECVEVLINGQPLDLDRIYRLATIDYLAKGGDYMSSLKRGKLIAKGDKVLYDDMIEEFRHGMFKGKTLNPSDQPRMKNID
ncbi:MAG: bifunctional metallophosphatase/5'-nucleotidase [Muribaculaceae bacterium]|nr:bifunctional metallophosphatase/5'-nucleotidase [Muribaculaceae bacterium]